MLQEALEKSIKHGDGRAAARLARELRRVIRDLLA
jgi:hypothetical protein